jgi:hypothetical protein
MSMKTVQGVVFKSDRFIIYRNSAGKKLSQKQLEALQSNWRAVDYNGYLSKSTRSKILNMLTAWADAINMYRRFGTNEQKKKDKRLRFLTLTLTKEQTLLDNVIKRKVLVPFISMLRAQCGLELYFWRAEAQQNGNIHFHLIIDCYVNKSRVNYLWDLCQWNADILDERPIYTEDYHTASTRIEAVQGEKAVAGYVCKYVTKEDGSRKIFGRIWGCSDELRNLSVPAMEFSNEIARDVTEKVDKKSYEIHHTDFFIIHHTSVLYDRIWEGAQIRTMLENYYYEQFMNIYKILQE